MEYIEFKPFRALELNQKYANSGMHYFPISEDIPIEGVTRTVNRDIIVEKEFASLKKKAAGSPLPRWSPKRSQ